MQAPFPKHLLLTLPASSPPHSAARCARPLPPRIPLPPGAHPAFRMPHLSILFPMPVTAFPFLSFATGENLCVLQSPADLSGHFQAERITSSLNISRVALSNVTSIACWTPPHAESSLATPNPVSSPSPWFCSQHLHGPKATWNRPLYLTANALPNIINCIS